ncbi:hypothetical protein BpHYR1_019923, partial [Brachionus plicatilis]
MKLDFFITLRSNRSLHLNNSHFFPHNHYHHHQRLLIGHNFTFLTILRAWKSSFRRKKLSKIKTKEVSKK